MLLKDICTIKSAKRIFENEYVDEGIPFVRGLEVSNHSLLKENTHFECYISKERYNEIKEKYGVPQIGDILITAVGTIGNLCFINKEFEFYYKDGNLIQFTNFKDCVNSHFLYYFMHSPIFEKSLEHSLIGAVQKALTMDMLGKIEIDLPDRKTQDKIAEILSGIDEQINRNNKIVKRLQVLAQTTYSRWFNQFEFPHNNKENIFNERLGKEIPKTWTVKTLSEVSNLYQPQTITEKEIQKSNGQYNVYGANGIIGTYHKYNHQNNEIAVTCRGNSCGNMLMTLPFSWITGNAMVVGITDSLKYKEYLYYYLKFTDLNRYITGSAQPQITVNNLGMLNVLIPDNLTLNLFENFAKNIRRQIEEITYNTNNLTHIKERLLPLFINGQLDI